eukprot:INCI14586.1.p1 GENE.INCI14586.1~~INCI14586.1.p1  ORF type:complete len:687 (+),score=126.46 INCI14586.1:120-2180(+)
MSKNHVTNGVDNGLWSDEYSEDFENFDFDNMMPRRHIRVSKSKTKSKPKAPATLAGVDSKSVEEPTVPVKYMLNGSLRRANLARPLNIDTFLHRLLESFGDSPTECQFQLTYQDDEGDTITIATTEELKSAAECAQSVGRVLLLNVETSKVNASSNKEPATSSTMTTQESIASAKHSATASLAAKKTQVAAHRQATGVEQMPTRKVERAKQAQLLHQRRAALAAERAARRALQANRERAAAAASTPLIPASTGRLEFEPMALVEIQQPTCLMYGRVISFNASLGKYLVMILGDDCGTPSRQLRSQSAHFAPHELTRIHSQPKQNVRQQKPPVSTPSCATYSTVGAKSKVYLHPFLHNNTHQVPARCRADPHNGNDHCSGRRCCFVRVCLFAVIAVYLTLSCVLSRAMVVAGVIALVAVMVRRSRMIRGKHNSRRCARRWRQHWRQYGFECLAAVDTSYTMEALPFIQIALLAIGFLSGTTFLPAIAWGTSMIAMAVKLLRVFNASCTGDNSAGIAPWAACIRNKFTVASRKVGYNFVAFVHGPKSGARDRRESFAVFLACLTGLLVVYLSLKFVTPIFWITHFLGTRNGFRARGARQQQQQRQQQHHQQPISSSGPCTDEQNEQQIVSSILAAIEQAPPALRASFSNQLFQALSKPKNGRAGCTRFNNLLRSLHAKGVAVTGLPLC